MYPAALPAALNFEMIDSIRVVFDVLIHAATVMLLLKATAVSVNADIHT